MCDNANNIQALYDKIECLNPYGLTPALCKHACKTVKICIDAFNTQTNKLTMK